MSTFIPNVSEQTSLLLSSTVQRNRPGYDDNVSFPRKLDSHFFKQKRVFLLVATIAWTATALGAILIWRKDKSLSTSSSSSSMSYHLVMDQQQEEWDRWKAHALQLYEEQQQHSDTARDSLVHRALERRHSKDSEKNWPPLLDFNLSTQHYLFESSSSAANPHFFPLAMNGWDAQINQGYCGVASTTAVLNSLLEKGVAPVVDLVDTIINHDDNGIPLSLPMDPIYKPYRYATQSNVLRFRQQCVNTHVVRYNDTFDGIFHAPGGLNLEQVRALVTCYLSSNSANTTNDDIHDHDVVNNSKNTTTRVLRTRDFHHYRHRQQYSVTAVHVDGNTTVHKLRSALLKALRTPSSRVIVNIDRGAMKQVPGHGGHFSPLAAYSSHLDAFLFLDTAKYRYSPFWVPTVRLHRAMQTLDICGHYDFPQAQDAIDPGPFNLETYLLALKVLNCRPAYRGYVLVEAN